MLATISVVGVLGVSVWRTADFLGANARSEIYSAKRPMPQNVDALTQQEMLLLGLATSINPSATATDVDPISLIGTQIAAQLVGQYAGLIGAGTYSVEAGAKAAEAIAGNVKAAVTYTTYQNSDLETDADISFDRMLGYKSDLRDAFAPLLENTADEFELYARYVDTQNPIYLEQLRAAAKHYREAADKTAHVVVPTDAVRYHIAILNAMQEFAATLDALAAHADDPLASVALLRTYNESESAVLYSFNDLGTYYRSKTP